MLLLRMARAGVDQVVLVSSLSDTTGNRTSSEAARRHPDKFMVMGRLDLRRPRGVAALAEHLKRNSLVGYRFAFFGRDRSLLVDGSCDWFWSAAERLGLPVMVFADGMCSHLARVAERHPGLRLAIDHLNLCPWIRDEDIAPLLAQTLALARHPNVSVKASGLPCHVTEQYPYPGLRDHIERVVDHFGPDRTFWGSDLSRLPCSYEEAVAVFRHHLDFLDPTDLALVMGVGVSRWLGSRTDAIAG
jgi:predicted TIM-barrel fold metal-dependent hydrolase